MKVFGREIGKSQKQNEEMLTEDRTGIRIKPKDTDAGVGVADNNENLVTTLLKMADSSTLDVDVFNKFRDLSEDREQFYKAFDEMAKDLIISAALDMYTEDATQQSTDGSIIWVESEDTDTNEFGNKLLEDLNLNANIKRYVRSLVQYGDLYLETFMDDEIEDVSPIASPLDPTKGIRTKHSHVGAQMLTYIEKHPNPATIFDLTKYGKTYGFINVFKDDENSGVIAGSYYSYMYTEEQVNVLRPDKYIHITLGEHESRFPEKVIISRMAKDRDELKKYTFNVKRGKSILHDIYGIFRTIKLMEDSVLLHRVTRSSITRVIQVEVGDAPTGKVREMLRDIKQLFEQKFFMDKTSGEVGSSTSPGGVENMVFLPTHEGKGGITSTNIGGDVDVKSLMDLDYFKNDLFGGLRIPKAFLGADMENTGLSNGGSLTKLSAQYARAVKNIQAAVCEGITMLINIFALQRGVDQHVNNFVVKMVSPTTSEDQERDEQMDNHINLISNLMSLISDDEYTTVEARQEVMKYAITNILAEPDIVAILEKYFGAAKKQVLKTDDGDEDFADDAGFDGGTVDFEGDLNLDTEPATDDEMDEFLNDEVDESGEGAITDEPTDFGPY